MPDSKRAERTSFLERLVAHEQAVRGRQPIAMPVESSIPIPIPIRIPSAPELSLAHPTEPNRDQLAFWQSQVARAAINRRITGDLALSPEAHFAATHGPAMPAAHALSLRAGDARLEVALVEAGKCRQVTGLDIDRQRAESANSNVPQSLRARIRFQQGLLAEWQPAEPVGAVLARSVLHRQADLEDVLDRIQAVLATGGLLFVDDFIGPARFQWTDAQLDAINRLLACLPDELLVDLTAEDGRRKRGVNRPVRDEFATSNPNDAVRSDEIVELLDERFERVDVRLYGGALYHQFFTRIMGNFVARPELIRMVMEVDAMLTDGGILASDYVWGVWRRR
jgi:SAM-dependent methyltransferase